MACHVGSVLQAYCNALHLPTQHRATCTCPPWPPGPLQRIEDTSSRRLPLVTALHNFVQGAAGAGAEAGAHGGLWGQRGFITACVILVRPLRPCDRHKQRVLPRPCGGSPEAPCGVESVSTGLG